MEEGLRKEQTNKQKNKKQHVDSHSQLEGGKVLQPLWRIVWQFVMKLNIHVHYKPVIPLWGIYLRDMNTYVCLQQELCKNVYTSFAHNSPSPPKSLLQFKANPKIP